ncbi:hypothetical protein IC614_03140 [Allosphingosinicella flava]|uniref:Uncharacterized protein n=1 Tax=Allosphingosinicella flava TaxID=2771430 RepID=A0A7T2LMY0_9SPHN|nr:hypothetical protein [Sphingosinicella flava]QPQ55612.1 hypothetical protein IC614_03140 [Sphingosinicella flava]
MRVEETMVQLGADALQAAWNSGDDAVALLPEICFTPDEAEHLARAVLTASLRSKAKEEE